VSASQASDGFDPLSRSLLKLRSPISLEFSGSLHFTPGHGGHQSLRAGNPSATEPAPCGESGDRGSLSLLVSPPPLGGHGEPGNRILPLLVKHAPHHMQVIILRQGAERLRGWPHSGQPLTLVRFREEHDARRPVRLMPRG